MSFLRDLLIYKWLFGGKKAKAKRDSEGNPICGDCRTVVDENATACPSCSASLYTWRGRFGRRVIGGLSALWVLAAIIAIADAGSIFQMIGIGIFALPAIIGILLGIHWRRNRPNRELNLRESLPF